MIDFTLFTTPRKKTYLVRAFNKPPIEIHPSKNNKKTDRDSVKIQAHITQLQKILKSYYISRKPFCRYTLSETDDSILIQMIRDYDL